MQASTPYQTHNWEDRSVPAVPIKDLKQYEKAIEVLTRVGGTWQGVGQDEWFLLVSEAQYKALVEAKVAPPEDGKKDQHRGKDSRKTARP
jgi:hypothetical protein